MISGKKICVEEKNFSTYNGLIMRTGQYAKSAVNKTNGLVDTTSFT